MSHGRDPAALARCAAGNYSFLRADGSSMSVPKPKTRTKSKAWKDLAITFVVAAVVFILAVQFDSFEKFAAWSARYNSWQVNEVAAVLVFLAFAFAIFSWRRWKELKAEINRRREYRDLFQLANDPILIFDAAEDRKSTRLNSSHTVISYAVFCLKKK